MIRKILKMRNVVAVAICLAVVSGFVGCGKCDETDPKSKCYVEPTPEPEPEKIDTSGNCTVRFQNTSSYYYKIYMDDKLVTMKKEGGGELQQIGGTESEDGGLWIFYDVHAGTREFYAEQQTGILTGQQPRKKTETLLLKTDSIYTWQFP